MTKIEEIYQKQWEQKWEGMTFRSIPEQQSHIFSAMKEYAEWYALKCIGMSRSETFLSYYSETGNEFDEPRIVHCQIELPNHEETE